MSDLLDLTAWTPCMGDVFCLELEKGQTIDLELIEASALPTQRGAPREDPFILVFRGPATCLLGQATRRLRHEQFGASELFLVPIGADEEGTYYQVIFN